MYRLDLSIILFKMRLWCCLALLVMLAMALGRVKEEVGEKLRSL